jgi:WhiB family redox-sensing transcriptional regulator
MAIPGDVLCAVTLERLLTRPAWHARAACRGVGPGPFYVERGVSLEPARQLCHGCPVAAECAEAGRQERHGIWAGLSARQRWRQPAA